jgi:HPt (histidine-containing phosphotransfer) domain-containing protein
MLILAVYQLGPEMKRRVNDASHKNLVMAYDPGILNASLAAAVGTDNELMAELRSAFLESAARQLDLMNRARCDANWVISASRLKSVSASFGATGLVGLADEALEGAPGDPSILRRIAQALDEFAAI